MAMEIRKMERLGIDMPLLGMGLMRLPMKGDVVDDELAMPMLDEMYAAGVRYFDTAYVYMNGESEKFAKRALVERYPRDSFCITSKLPIDRVKSPEDNERIFSTSCERMGVDYIDFYLLHGINYGGWCEAKKKGSVEFQRKLKEDGRIRFRGFSFHGSTEDMKKILAEEPDWDFIQIQLNYYDYYTDNAKELYDIVAEKNIPLIVMEPVRGGGLFDMGDDIREIFAAARPEDSNAKWAMRWVGSQPAVNVVLSGVSTIEQVRENVGFFAPLEKITDYDKTVIEKVVKTIMCRPYIWCTGCRYCSGCPQEIHIPRIFYAVNEYTRLNDAGKAMWAYSTIPDGHKADSCIECGYCVTQCPQSINIPQELARCREIMEKLAADRK